MKKKNAILLITIILLVINAKAQIPTVTFTTTANPICAGSCEVFVNTATNAPTSWTWYFPGAVPSYTIVSTPPGNPPCITYPRGGIYPVTCVVRNNFGSDSVTISNCVQVLALPTATISPAYGGICDTNGGSDFDTVYFNASGSLSNTYSWVPINGGLSCTACPNPKATPTATTVYTITVTGIGGCQSIYHDTVTVGYVTAHITGKDSICIGSIDSLYASGGSQNPPGTTYLWLPGGQTTASIGVSPTVTTTYSCQIIAGIGGCQSMAAITVYPFPVPIYTLNYYPADSICYPQSVILTALPGGGMYQYSWYGPFGFQDTTNSWTVSPNVNTTYTLVVRNKGCVVDTLLPIKVSIPPVITMTGANTLCQGSSTIISIIGGTCYHWSTGATTSSITVKPPASITYTVEVCDGACYKDTSFTIIVDSMPNVRFRGDTSICVGDSTTIYVSGGGTYAWSNGSTADSIFVNGSTPGLYTYYVTVTKGSCSKDSSKITVRVQACTGIQTYSNPVGIEISPNPANSVLMVEMENVTGQNALLSVTDIAGREMLVQKIKSLQNQVILDVSSLASGIYFIKLQTQLGVAVRKFVKL